MTYAAPLADIRFTLREVAGQAAVAALPGYENATDDMIRQQAEAIMKSDK